MSARPSRTRNARCFLAMLAGAALLSGCAELDANLKKAVAIKYQHVANVRSFQASVNNTQRQLGGVNPGSFWALFDICSIDVQGSSLAGFNYDANRFFVEAGNARYDIGTPDTINVSSEPMSSQTPLVVQAARGAFQLGPPSQFFPRQFFPTLRYRIAIFVRENPPGYRGDFLTLGYDGQPQVAALVQLAPQRPDGPVRPAAIDFYLPGATAPIASTCF
ncbi:hypothetical protein [Massilia sp. DWR3-1-1]|uniref:hypothetical protein n=1 Tax=Massilia sp. DWR3-1-1 TaxID=2804559 RepID=UPI003CF91BA3